MVSLYDFATSRGRDCILFAIHLPILRVRCLIGDTHILLVCNRCTHSPKQFQLLVADVLLCSNPNHCFTQVINHAVKFIHPLLVGILRSSLGLEFNNYRRLSGGQLSFSSPGTRYTWHANEPQQVDIHHAPLGKGRFALVIPHLKKHFLGGYFQP